MEFSPSLHDQVGLTMIKNTQNSCVGLCIFLPPPLRAHDTVGAVAVDSAGNVACATSTGGIRNKMVGRVGDSSIIGAPACFLSHQQRLWQMFTHSCVVFIISVCLSGCGGYADNLSGAVSCTGHGESILKVTLARLILSHMEQGNMGVLYAFKIPTFLMLPRRLI